MGGAGAYPSGHQAEGRIHPGQVASPSQQSAVLTCNRSRAGALPGLLASAPQRQDPVIPGLQAQQAPWEDLQAS
ncbi:hypothetical protein AOLI_G00261260 [Acnodon oligacanthus]